MQDRDNAVKEVNLTPRLVETLKYLLQGLTIQETANQMGIGRDRITKNFWLIRQRLRAANREEAFMQGRKWLMLNGHENY